MIVFEKNQFMSSPTQLPAYANSQNCFTIFQCNFKMLQNLDQLTVENLLAKKKIMSLKESYDSSYLRNNFNRIGPVS